MSMRRMGKKKRKKVIKKLKPRQNKRKEKNESK